MDSLLSQQKNKRSSKPQWHCWQQSNLGQGSKQRVNTMPLPRQGNLRSERRLRLCPLSTPLAYYAMLVTYGSDPVLSPSEHWQCCSKSHSVLRRNLGTVHIRQHATRHNANPNNTMGTFSFEASVSRWQQSNTCNIYYNNIYGLTPQTGLAGESLCSKY
jgi:hypothetical protein